MRFYTLILVVLLTTGIFTISQAQVNTTFLGQLDYTDGVNDVWGYVDTDGTEYALVGLQTGVSIVSLLNPVNPKEVQFISGPNTGWRDLKTWGNYAFVINESSEGLLIIDLSDMEDISWSRFEPTMPGGSKISSCHNLFIDSTGRLYVTGCNVNNGGIVILDLTQNILQPPVVGQGPNIYSHDVFVYQNKMFASEIYEGRLAIYDISNVNNVALIATETTPFNFTHNAWTTADGNYVFTTDERADAYTASYDISVDGQIELLDLFRPLATEGRGVIPHNVHVTEDNFLVLSHYTDGCVIVDANRPHNLIEVGNYDSYPGNDGGFSGAWGAYPFLPSGRVLISDRQGGLFVIGVDYKQACYLEGLVTDYITGTGIPNASVQILNGDLNESTTDLDGTYNTGQVTAGSFDVEITATGYRPQTITVNLANGVLTELNVELVPLWAIVNAGGQIYNAIDSTPINDANIEFKNASYSYNTYSGMSGAYATNNTVIGSYDGRAAAWGFQELVKDTVILETAGEWPDLYLFPGYEDSYSLDQGWEVSGTASQGQWVRVKPTGQVHDNIMTAPGADLSTDLGERCFVTGNGADTATLDGVIDGTVRLTSPLMDLSKYNVPAFEWAEWVYLENETESTFSYGLIQDTVEVRLGGSRSENSWQRKLVGSALLTGIPSIDLRQPLQIYFELENEGQAIAEAGVDAFRVIETDLEQNFTLNESRICVGDSVTLTDVNNHTVSWHWEIYSDDVLYDSVGEKSIKVAIEEPGLYNVKLTAYSCFGDTITLIQQGAINVFEQPSANFEIDSISGNTVFLHNLGSNFTLASWDFGDGNTGTGIDPVHSFLNDGEFEIQLITENPCGSDTFSVTVDIRTLPEASFNVDVNAGCAPLEVQFENMSSANSIDLEWIFEGGEIIGGSDEDPLVRYNERGEFGVTLIATSTIGSDTMYRPDIIRVQDVPITDFDYSLNGTEASFNNLSEYADSYVWDFGDGEQSTEQDPTHDYQDDGTYIASLTAINSCGEVIHTDTISVITSAIHPVSPMGVHVYPNPFRDELTIELPATSSWYISVHTLTGQAVDQIVVGEQSHYFQMGSTWESGIYLLRWHDKDGKLLAVSRVIKI